MVAIEHRQKSAIIATDSTDSVVTTSIATSTILTTSSSSPRRSSDIVNSNDITVLSPSIASTSSSTTISTTANSNIIVVKPINSKDNEEIQQNNTESPNSQKRLSKMSQSSSEASTVTAESAAAVAATKLQQEQQQKEENSQEQQKEADAEPAAISKSAVSQRNVDIKIASKSNKEAATKELTKKVLKLDLTGKELDEYSIKSPKSPIATRLPHQTSLTTVDVEDRKTLREALYHGIFHRHRRTIFAVGSFLRMLRSRNSSYNTIRSSSEGEDIDEVR